MTMVDKANPGDVENDQSKQLVIEEERKFERRRKFEAIAIPIGTVICLLMIWQVGVRLFGVPRYIAPAPSEVAEK